MKKVVFLLFLTTIAMPKAKAQVGYYAIDLIAQMIGSWEEGGYELKQTYFNNEPAFLHGIKGGWFVDQNDNFLIGIGGYVASTRINESISLLNSQKLNMFHSTFYFDYTFPSENRFKLNPVLHVGMGVASLEGGAYANSNANLPTAARYFLIEPNMNACYQLGNRVRIGAGMGYRQLSRFALRGADNLTLSGISFNFFIKFSVYN